MAEHSFGSLWVYSFTKSWQGKGCSSQAETWQSEKYTDERFWLPGKIWVLVVSMAAWTIEYNLKFHFCSVYIKFAH